MNLLRKLDTFDTFHCHIYCANICKFVCVAAVTLRCNMTGHGLSRNEVFFSLFNSWFSGVR